MSRGLTRPDPEPPPAPAGDGELIRRIKAGDEFALGQLMEAHWASLRRFAWSILSGVGDPQDIVQEAFIRFWHHRERWDDQGSTRALLYRLVRNAALDERRRLRRSEGATQKTEPPPHAPTPAEDAAEGELRAAIAAAVAALPPRRREVFRLVRESGLTYAETARALELSEQTVANHMSMALADLRAALERFRPSPRGQRND